MIVFALVLVVVVAVFVLGVVVSSTGTAEFSFFDIDGLTSETTAGTTFLIGAIAGAVLVVGLWLLLAASRRARRKSDERRALEKRSEELERERVELARRLGRDVDPAESADEADERRGRPDDEPIDQSRFQPRAD